MKKMLKCLHLFAGVLFASLSFATVEPVAVWSGDLEDNSTKNDITLTLNGNSVSEGVVTIDQVKGIQFYNNNFNAKTITVLVKYSNLTTSDKTKRALISIGGGSNSTTIGTRDDAVCLSVDGDLAAGGIKNGTTNTAGSKGSFGEFGVLAVAYNGGSAGTKGYMNGTLVYSAIALRDSNMYTRFISVGGNYAIVDKLASPATSMKIEGVAIFKDVLSATDIAAYEFPAPSPGPGPEPEPELNPVVVWNGDFDVTEKDGYTLNLNNHTVATDGSHILMGAGTNGIEIDWDIGIGAATVIFKCEDVSTEVVAEKNSCYATVYNTQSLNRVGVIRRSADGKLQGVWANTPWGSSPTPNFPTSTGNQVYALGYQYDKGTIFCSNVNDTWTTLLDDEGLGSPAYDNNSIKGFSILGCRGSSSNMITLEGAKVTAVAVFDKKLTAEEIAAYEFPKNPSGPKLVWEGNSASEGKILSQAVEKGKPFTLIVNMVHPDENTPVGSYIINKVPSAGQSFTPFCIATDLFADFDTSGSVPNSSVYFYEKKSGGFWVGVGSRSNEGNGTSKEEKKGDDVAAYDSIYVAYSGTVGADGVVANYTRMIYAHNKNTDQYYTLSDTTASLTIFDSLDTMNVNSSADTLNFKVYLDNTQRDTDGIRQAIEDIINPPAFIVEATISGGTIKVSNINALDELKSATTETTVNLTITASSTIEFDEPFKCKQCNVILNGTLTFAGEGLPDYEEYSKFNFKKVTSIDYEWIAIGSGMAINFHSSGRSLGDSDEAGIPGLTIYGNCWNNYDEATGNVTAKMFAPNGSDIIGDTMPVNWSCANVYQWDDASVAAPYLKGYLDDTNNALVLSATVPFGCYDLYIICATDNENVTFAPKVVNGAKYTANASGEAIKDSAGWGMSHGSAPIFGTNVMRVSGLTAQNLTINAPRENGRGGIAAIVIVKVLPAKIVDVECGDAKLMSEINAIEADAVNLYFNDGGVLTVDVAPNKQCNIVGGSAVTLDGWGNATVADGDWGKFDFARATGNITLKVNASNGLVAPTLKSMIQSAGNNLTFIFKGLDDAGVTLDFGQTTESIKCHVVFDGGTHSMTYMRGSGQGNPFGQNGTDDNPTILITGGATLNFTAKDISYWNGVVDMGGVIRVNDGATLNFRQSGGDSFFYRQRLWLDPGALVTFNHTANKFCWHGGIQENMAQIYVPESDQNSEPAIIRAVGAGGFDLPKDDTRGVSVFVGANSRLVLDTSISMGENNPQFKKTGPGDLEITGNVALSANCFTIDDGKLIIGGLVSNLTLTKATTIGVAEGKTATISAILGNYAITKTGAGTLNLPTAYTQPITLAGGLIGRTATNTIVINGNIDLGTTEMPLAWTLSPTSTGSIKLPTGFQFGQIVKASEIPSGLAFYDNNGAEITFDRLEIVSGYIELKKSEIKGPYDVNAPTSVEGDLLFGEGGVINILNADASLTVSGTITLPENGLPVTFVCGREYVKDAQIKLITAAAFKIGGDDATIDDFDFSHVTLPKGMAGEFRIVDGMDSRELVYVITESKFYTSDVATILEKSTLQVRFDASYGVVVDDNGKVTEWKDISGNGNNARPVRYKHITDTPTLFSSDDDLREYVDFGVRGSHQDLRIGSTVNGKTIFLVIDIQEDKDAFILGWGNDSDSYGGNYDFHRNVLYYFNGDSQVFAVRDNKVDKGNGRSELLKSGFRVLSLRTDGNGRFNSFSSDRNGCSDGENRTGGRKLCEVISFSEKLSDEQTETIEDYLAEKWGLNYRNEANIVGEIAWSEIQWKGGRYYADIETTLTVTGNTVLTFDTPIGNPDIEFSKESPDYRLDFVIEKESGYAPDMMIGAGEQLTLRGGTPEDPFVYTGWVSVEEGGTLVIDGGSVECEGFWGDGIVDVQRGEFRLGSMRGVKLRFAEDTELLVDANSADDGEVTLMFESGSASPIVRFVDGEARHAVIIPVAGGVKITYDPVVSGKACLYDWTFDNGPDKGENRLASVGMNTSALHWDTGYNASNGFVPDEAFTYGIALKTQSTPYSDFTVDYPTEWTCMVAGVLPNVTNGALITFGTQGGGLIGLIAGSTENEVKIVRTTGNSQYVALATMTVPNARTTSHCYAFVKTEEKIVVYLDAVKWNETEVRGANFGASLQIGSVHGGAGSTGIIKVDSATNATAIQAVRIYEGVLGPKSLRKLAEEFPYLSENGTFTRTFSSASENWVSDESWAKVGSGDKFSEPDAGSELKITTAANTTVKMNFDGANAVYENISVNGSGSLTFDVGGEGYSAVNAGKTDVNVPITVKYGSLTIAAGPTTIGSSGSITFDYSAYPVDTIHSEGFIPLTGQIDEQSSDKIKLVKPTALLERRMNLVYRDKMYGIEYGFARDPIDLYFKNPTAELALTNETELVDIDGNVKLRVMKDDALAIANNATFTIATNALDVQLSTLKITNATVTVNIPASNLNGLAKIIVEDGGTLKFDSATDAAYTGAVIVNEGGVFDVNGIPDLLMAVTLNGGTMTNSGADVGVDKKQFPTMNFTDDSIIDVAHDFGSIAQGYGAHTVNLDGNVVEKRGAGNYYLANATIGGGGEFKVTEGTLAISSGLTIPADTEFKLTVDSAATISFADTVTKSGVFNLELGGSLSAPITLAIDELTINEGAIIAITSTTAIIADNAVQNGSFTVDLSQLELDETRKQLLVAPGLDIASIDFTVAAAIEKRLYRLVYIDNVLYVEPNNLTIAIPSVDNADVSVLVDGEIVEVVDDSITIIRGSYVFVKYVADPGWLFDDETDHSRAQYSIELSDVQEVPNPSIAELLDHYIPLVEARVSIDDIYYLYLSDALAEVAANDEICLLKAVVLGDEYNVSCDMAINLNGFELSADEALSFTLASGNSLYLYDGYEIADRLGGALNNIRFNLSDGTIYSYLNLDGFVDSEGEPYVKVESDKYGYTYVSANRVSALVDELKKMQPFILPESKAWLIEAVKSMGYEMVSTMSVEKPGEYKLVISPDEAVNGSKIESFEIAGGKAMITIPAKSNLYYGLEYANNPAFSGSQIKWAKQGAKTLSAEAEGANMFYRVVITDKDPNIK